MQIRNLLPNYLKKVLWGDRSKWGKLINYSDRDWVEWEKTYTAFYSQNQRAGVGQKVNEAGYKVMSDIDLSDLSVLEIGPGDIQHLKYVQGSPDEYVIADISKEMLEIAQAKLRDFKIDPRSIILKRGDNLPIKSNSMDVIISFFALEHLHPLKEHLHELHRILKPGGTLIGAIPCEGGLAWGLGRTLTSRRWFKKNTNIDLDKIICWEHPNFSDEIVTSLDDIFQTKEIQFWPFKFIKHNDFNLVIKFQYVKQ